MADITYCMNNYCPFTDCERHSDNAPRGIPVSLAWLDGTCRGCSACDGGFGDNTMVFYAGGYKHCPMCGRRLEEV